MPSTQIRLPGSGATAPMFRFGEHESLAERLMNLPLLEAPQGNASDSCGYDEQWQAPAPISISKQDNQQPAMRVMTGPHYQLSCINCWVGPDCVRELTRCAYQRLLAYVSNSAFPQLIRAWNYIPDINRGSGDAEVYRQFCWGRAEALEPFNLPLPAATGIGSHDGWLRICVLSTSQDTQVTHWENPRQLSAYQYPRQYGPRSPSFARATSIARDGQRLLLLSGTSSIVDHETQHTGDLAAQVAETRRNIDHLLEAYQAKHPTARRLEPQAVRFYLRDPRQLTLAKTSFQQAFGQYPEPTYFAADICRADLGMEVEAIFC